MKPLRKFYGCCCILIGFLISGCGLSDLTSSLGGAVAGRRGVIRVLFINNTTFQPLFTYGTYDHTDQNTRPDFRQFVLDEAAGPTLSAGAISPAVSLTCGRVFAIGSQDLLDRIERNLPGAERNAQAFAEGIQFLDVGDGGGTAPPLQDQAPPFQATLGVDFPCEALLLIRLEVDDPEDGEFIVDFEIIPSQSTR